MYMTQEEYWQEVQVCLLMFLKEQLTEVKYENDPMKTAYTFCQKFILILVNCVSERPFSSLPAKFQYKLWF